MKTLELHKRLAAYLTKHGLKRKFEKQKSLFENSPFHPSLETELLEPKHLRFWNFRIDRKYRAIFIFREKERVEIVDINNHYK